MRSNNPCTRSPSLHSPSNSDVRTRPQAFEMLTATDVTHLKEFYLQRLTRTQELASPGLEPNGSEAEVKLHLKAPPVLEDVEVMCNICLNLVIVHDAVKCTADPVQHKCETSMQVRQAGIFGQLELLNSKLKNLRAALESRLLLADSNIHVMRQCTKLRYLIDTALNWAPGCVEIGPLSENTIQQVQQLTATSEGLNPALYAFSKRIQYYITQKDRALRKAGTQRLIRFTQPISDAPSPCIRKELSTSTVHDLTTDSGTQCTETFGTQEELSSETDNQKTVNLSFENEDEQRRWFYTHCLSAKLACNDQSRARKILISDLYSKVRADAIPVNTWANWITSQFGADDSLSTAPGTPGGASSSVPTEVFRQQFSGGSS